MPLKLREPFLYSVFVEGLGQLSILVNQRLGIHEVRQQAHIGHSQWSRGTLTRTVTLRLRSEAKPIYEIRHVLVATTDSDFRLSRRNCD